MSWVAVGVAGTSMVVGQMNANAQRKQQQKANEQNAAITAAQMEASPWTDIKPQEAKMGSDYGPGAGGAVSGALGGAMFAKENNMGVFGEPKMSSKDAAALDPAMAGQDMTGDYNEMMRKKMLAGTTA